jgi:hypothetical protein
VGHVPPVLVREDSLAAPVRLVRERAVLVVRALVDLVDLALVVVLVVRALVDLVDLAPVVVLVVVPVVVLAADLVAVPVVALVRPADVARRAADVVGVVAKKNCCRPRFVTPRPMRRCPRASSSSNEVYRHRSSLLD